MTYEDKFFPIQTSITKQGLPTIQFLIVCSMKKWRGGGGGGGGRTFYHVSDVNICLVDRVGEGPSNERVCLRHFLQCQSVHWSSEHL